MWNKEIIVWERSNGVKESESGIIWNSEDRIWGDFGALIYRQYCKQFSYCRCRPLSISTLLTGHV